MPGKATMRRVRRGKWQSEAPATKAVVVREEMHITRAGKRAHLPAKALAIGVAKARLATEEKAETLIGKKVRRVAKARSIARKRQHVAALRRGKARLQVAKKVVRAKGRQAVRKAKRTRRLRAS
jgi:hypothetical protein